VAFVAGNHPMTSGGPPSTLRRRVEAAAREHREKRARILFDIRCIGRDVGDRQQLHEFSDDLALVMRSILARDAQRFLRRDR
jgi:hypothetical protein